jgi:hypothetical protein
MNWYKKAQTKAPFRSIRPSLRRYFIDELINKLPEGYTFSQEAEGWSVADETGRKLVYNEPNLLYALRLALVRWKMIN